MDLPAPFSSISHITVPRFTSKLICCKTLFLPKDLLMPRIDKIVSLFFSSIFIPLLYLIPILFFHHPIVHLSCTFNESTKWLSQNKFAGVFQKLTKFLCELSVSRKGGGKSRHLMLLRFYICSYLLLKKSGIRSCIVCLNHIDCECIIFTRISKSVCDIRLCLSVTCDVFNLEV